MPSDLIVNFFQLPIKGSWISHPNTAAIIGGITSGVLTGLSAWGIYVLGRASELRKTFKIEKQKEANEALEAAFILREKLHAIITIHNGFKYQIKDPTRNLHEQVIQFQYSEKNYQDAKISMMRFLLTNDAEPIDNLLEMQNLSSKMIEVCNDYYELRTSWDNWIFDNSESIETKDGQFISRVYSNKIHEAKMRSNKMNDLISSILKFEKYVKKYSNSFSDYINKCKLNYKDYFPEISFIIDEDVDPIIKNVKNNDRFVLKFKTSDFYNIRNF